MPVEFNKRTKKEETVDQVIDAAVFAVLLAIVSAVTLVLFYCQTMGSPEQYHSDMKAYILEMQGLDSGYSFPYPIFFWLSAFLDLFVTPEFAVALATMLLNSLAIVITRVAFGALLRAELKTAIRERRKRLEDGGKRCLLRNWMAGVVLSLLSISLFFISMLYPPEGIYLPGISFKYLGVFTANPFHNATYMAARPFSILAFLWCVKLLPVYEKGLGKAAKWRDYALFSLFLLLATMTKPSFTIVLLGAAGLIMLYRLFQSRWKNFMPTIQLGFCFIPTFIDLLYQFSGVFVPKEGEEGGIGFCFGEVWGYYCSNIPLAICLAVGFPILVLLLNHKELKKNMLYRFSWQIYLMSFAMAFLMYEKGFRKPDFNFSWGYMYGIFFCHMGALLVLVKATAAALSVSGNMAETDETLRRKTRQQRVGLWLQWAAYFCHVICGIFYFKGFMNGKMYY